MVGHWINWPTHITSTASNTNYLLKGNSENPQAIVILGGGRRKGALETPPDYQQQELSEALMMKLVFEQKLGLSPQWFEEQSNTTQENAKFTANLLKAEGVKTIYLVTHFWHMPLAKTVFKKEGLYVIEAPMGFYQKKSLHSFGFLFQ